MEEGAASAGKAPLVILCSCSQGIVVGWARLTDTLAGWPNSCPTVSVIWGGADWPGGSTTG
jgi:hypothetical protein